LGKEPNDRIKKEYKKKNKIRLFFLLISIFITVLSISVYPTIGAVDVSVSDTYTVILNRISPDHFNIEPKENELIFTIIDDPDLIKDGLRNGIVTERLKDAFYKENKKLSDDLTVYSADGRWILTDISAGTRYIIKEELGGLAVYNILPPDFVNDIIWERINRCIIGLLIGAGLAISGTTMQGILRNRFASPFTLGIFSMATVGVVIGNSFGLGISLTVLLSFLFAFSPFIFYYYLSRYKEVGPETMVLIGIALVFTLLPLSIMGGFGSIKAVPWSNILIMSIVMIICLLVLMFIAWDINMISLGDTTAKTLGIEVDRIKLVSLCISSFIVAIIVSFASMIPFIGLVAPFLCRPVIGNDNRFLLPSAAFIGASLVLMLDGLGRTVMAPMILPAGILSMFLGGPVLLYLAIRKERLGWL
jgi:iron complex transport system permease protein